MRTRVSAGRDRRLCPMPWIEQVPVEESSGLLREQFDQALGRAGRIWPIVHVMSVNPEALRDSIGLYLTIMKGDSPLTRIQREMLATVVSRELECHY
jgi:alkylhydroperoxidase family enzyme